jgi:hypothetical protein
MIKLINLIAALDPVVSLIIFHLPEKHEPAVQQFENKCSTGQRFFKFTMVAAVRLCIAEVI